MKILNFLLDFNMKISYNKEKGGVYNERKLQKYFSRSRWI